MNMFGICLCSRKRRESLRAIAAIVSVFLFGQPAFKIVVDAEGRTRVAKKQSMTEDQRIAHVLSRLTFGARPGDFERVKAMGVETFIAQQLDSDSFDDSAVIEKLKGLPTLGMATPVIIERYTPPKPATVPSPSPKAPDNNGTPAQASTTQNPRGQSPLLMSTSNSGSMTTEISQKPETMKSPAAMPKPSEPQQQGMSNVVVAPKPTPAPNNPQMVVTDLQRAALLRAVYSERQLYEVMVSFWENHFNVFANKDDDRYLLTSFDRDTIRPFALGRFRDLLGATAHSPAMLFYLDNWRSSVPRPYAATKDKPAGVDGGFNENYARELMELHTLGVDGGYTQKDVQEVARCFSGWTIEKPNQEGLFLYRPGLHDNGEKVVLGHKIPAGGGIADGERVLDILAMHPATAHFISIKLARHFISDDPPQSVVNRAAQVFLKTDGSIRETLRAIVTSPEFFSAPVYRAKIRSPFEYVVAAMRALNAETDGDRPVLDAIGRMGQPLFGRITPDGYADRADQWLSSGAMIARFNFAAALATNRIKGTSIKVDRLLADTDQTNRISVADKLIRLTIIGEVSKGTRAALEKTSRLEPIVSPVVSSGNVSVAYDAKALPPPKDPESYISELITLLLGSPEFQQR